MDDVKYQMIKKNIQSGKVTTVYIRCIQELCDHIKSMQELGLDKQFEIVSVVNVSL